MFTETFAVWQTATQTFIQTMQTIPEPLRKKAGLCGEWSSQQVIAHLAGWQREALHRFKGFLAGDTTKVRYDADDFNAKNVAALRLLNWRETLETFQQTTEDLIALVATFPPDLTDTDHRFEKWFAALTEDIHAHTAEVAPWLVQEGQL